MPKSLAYKFITTHSLCCYTIPCESLRHKSNTFHTNISTLHMFISITFTETSIDETNKTQSESQKLKIYVQNVHHSCEHMHSNDYATAQSLPRWRCAWFSSLHSLSRRSFNSYHGSTSGRPSLVYPNNYKIDDDLTEVFYTLEKNVFIKHA